MTIEALYAIYRQFPSVQTDTRSLQKDDLFFALKGDHFNGNLFALQALEKGAAYAVIDQPVESTDPRLILVNDTLKTLQDLAAYHRSQLRIPVIAITGSNGKTTTKELLHAVLSQKFRTYTTKGNLNNHIGIPFTLLRIRQDAEMAVVEMGANHQQEIAGYCLYAQPNYGIITNCGKAHLEGFGGVEGVRKGKGELYDYIRKHKGVVFMNSDYDYLKEMSVGIRELVTYGSIPGASISGTVEQSNPFLKVAVGPGFSFTSIHTQLVGDYNLPNVLCALAVGHYFKVEEELIKAALENYTPSNSRSQLIEKGTNSFILDAYNANPSSMKLAVENFARLEAPQNVLLLGGMMELGTDSIAEHTSLLALIAQYTWKSVILVGGDFKGLQHSYLYFDNSEEAKHWLDQQHFESTSFLVKGSRSMRMERVLE